MPPDKNRVEREGEGKRERERERERQNKEGKLNYR